MSRWEKGTSYPDITLVPKIANFFGVTADELLGMKHQGNTDELEKYEAEFNKNMREGKVFDNITLCHEVLEKYPRNHKWMIWLARTLPKYNANSQQIKYSRENGFIEEIISLCERVREDCTVDSLRYQATLMLCGTYPAVGKRDIAIQLANEMPRVYMGRELLLSSIYEGEERIKQDQENLLTFISWCATNLELSCEAGYGEFLSAEEKIHYLETANTLIKTILGEEQLFFYNVRLCNNHTNLAKIWCSLGNYRETMNNLLLAERYAAEYDKCNSVGRQSYKSVFVNRCTYNPEDTAKNYEGTRSLRMLDIINKPDFAVLHKEPEFRALQKRLAGR